MSKPNIHTIFPALAASISMFFVISLSTAGKAEPTLDNPTHIILLIEPEEDLGGEFEQLEEALEAHLGSSSIEVRTHRIESLPKKHSKQVKQAKNWARKQNASAVIWIDISRQTMFLIFEDATGMERTLDRYFECISESLGECGDAIASAVNSALSVWIGHSPPPQKTNYSVEDNELSPVALNSTYWNEPLPLVSLYVGAGYASIYESSNSNAHGIQMRVGSIWRKHLSLEVSSEFLSSITTGTGSNGRKIEIKRWPLRFLAGGVLPFGNLSAIFSVGLVLGMDVTYASLGDSSNEDYVYTVPGFTTILSFQVPIFKYLVAWARGGVDIYSEEHVLRIELADSSSEVVARVGDINWSLSCGFALSFEILNTR